MHLLPLRRKIARILTAIFLVLLLLTVLAGAIKEPSLTTAHYNKIMLARLNIAESLIDTVINQHNRIIRSAITMHGTQNIEQLCETLVSLHALFMPENIFYILDKDGRVHHISNPHSEYKKLDFSTIIPTGWEQQDSVSGPHQSLITNNYVIKVSYPLSNGYLLVNEISLDIFPAVMNNLAKGKFDDDEIFFVLSSGGRTIYHSDHTFAKTSYNLAFDVNRQIISYKNGLLKFTLDGNDFVSISSQFEKLPGWSIYYAIPESVIESSIISRIRDRVIYISIFSVFLLAGLLITLSRYFTGPVSKIVKGVAHSKPGEFISMTGDICAGIKEFDTIITAIKSRDREIINRFEKFKIILNSLDTAIYAVCVDSHEIIFVNNACKDIYGDYTGQPCFQYLCSKNNSFCDHCTTDIIAGGCESQKPQSGIQVKEIQNKLTGRWIECRKQTVVWPDGRIVHLKIETDINDRKKAEEILTMEKERLAVTLRSIGDAVITTDIKGKITMINRVAEELTGWINDEAVGKASTEVFNIINEKTGQKCVSPVQRVMDLGRIVGLANHTALIGKTGVIHPIADSGAPIRDSDSKIMGVVIVFRNITHERKMEEELLKIKKLESVGVLAGGIAHDFNNILTAILGNISLLQYHIDPDDEKKAALLSDADKATRRAIKLTGQLLTFAKGGNPVKEETSLPGLIRDSAEFVLHGSQVGCRYEFPDDLWMIDADIGQISQVIQNIIINSRHAMPEGGIITVNCANIENAANEALLSMDNGNYLRIIIKDTGVGIPREIIDKVFDPYFTTKQEGSGLGLAICYSIINKHDGYLLVDSKPGKGTLFTIYLPALPATTIKVKTQPTRTKAMKSALIMVMDDDQMILNVVSAQLHTLGHKPVLTRDGEELINRYQALQDEKTPVDAVIMDLTIPGGMGGLEAIKKLLAIDPLAKVIVASGYSNDPVMTDYKKYGFSAAIGKPFSLDELARVIESILD